MNHAAQDDRHLPVRCGYYGVSVEVDMPNARAFALAAALLFAFLLPAPGARAEEPATAPWQTEQRGIFVPMRDGERLSADVYLPPQPGRYPCVLIQTPYDKRRMRTMLERTGGYVGEVARGAEADLSVMLDRAHYAYVVTDWRGFYGSKVTRMGRSRGSVDGYDTVEWCAGRPWSNGRVGTWGGSALGKRQFETAREHPPHLVCCVPLIAAMGQSYEAYFDGGVPLGAHLKTLDFLGFGVSKKVRAAPHPGMQLYRIARRWTYRPELIQVPCLLITGWWDNYPDLVIETFEDILTKGGGAARTGSRLLIGPWDHVSIGVAKQGDLTFRGAALESGRVAKAFLDLHLRGIPDEKGLLTPRIRYWQVGEGGWKTGALWSHLPRTTRRLHLHADGSILDAPPTEAQPLLRAYAYDPRKPSPTLGGANLPPLPHGPKRHDALTRRADVLTYRTETLTEPLAANGNVTLDLTFTCNRVDVDLTARLCDVHPDGSTYLVADTAVRAKLRNGKPELLEPGKPYAVRLVFPSTAYTFLDKHRLALFVSSGHGPRYEPNTHTGADVWDPDQALTVEVKIHHDAARPAVLTIPQTR